MAGFGNKNIRTLALRSPARPARCVVSRLNNRRYSPDKGAGAVSAKNKLAKGGTYGSTVGRGCWSLRRAAGKQRHGKVLATNRPTLLDSSLHGSEGRNYARRRRIAAGGAIRCGGGGPLDRPAPHRYGGFSGKLFPNPSSFEERRLNRLVRPTSLPIGTKLSTGCVRQGA
jgi:hypothetical protein